MLRSPSTAVCRDRSEQDSTQDVVEGQSDAALPVGMSPPVAVAALAPTVYNAPAEGAVAGNVFGSYLHGPVLPANPRFADALIKLAVERALGEPFVPGRIDDQIADQARTRQVRRLVSR